MDYKVKFHIYIYVHNYDAFLRIKTLVNCIFVPSTGSSHSGSSKKEGKEKGERKSVSPMGSGSDSDAASLVSGRRVQPGERPGAPPTNLGALPPELSGSRQSFRMAMGNPCEFFVDVM